MRTALVFMLLFAGLPARTQITQFCMFPGDANNDGRANYLDLLPIGAAYNETILYEFIQDTFIDWHLRCALALNIPPVQVTPKEQVSNNFSPLNTIVHPGFSDSDGNGHVDSLDIFAIKWNYDSVQNSAIPPAAAYLPPLLPTTGCARIQVKFQKDSLNDKKFYALIFAETQPSQGTVAMAAGMRMHYTPAYVVEDSTKVLFDPAATDLMGIGATHGNTSFERQLSSGAVDVAVSGRKQNVLNGIRQIATVQFIVIEDIILRNDTIDFKLDIDPDSLMVINKDEFRICAEVIQDSIKLIFLGQGSVATAPQIRVYPNPVSEVLHIDCSGNAGVVALRLFNASGQLVQESAALHALPMGQLPAGLYQLQILTRKEVVWKGIVKQ